jgi:hypothetical protein
VRVAEYTMKMLLQLLAFDEMVFTPCWTHGRRCISLVRTTPIQFRCQKVK